MLSPKIQLFHQCCLDLYFQLGKSQGFDLYQRTGRLVLQPIDQGAPGWEESNQNLAVPVMWSAAINGAIQKIFKELSFADPNWLKELYDSAADDGIAPELFVIELLQLLLGEAVVQNSDLLEAIKEIGQQPAIAIPAGNLDAHRKSLSKLFSRLYYSELADTTPVMTGDIFHLDDNTFGVVVTPECDIDHMINNEGCEIDLLTFKSDGFEEGLRVKISFFGLLR